MGNYTQSSVLNVPDKMGSKDILSTGDTRIDTILKSKGLFTKNTQINIYLEDGEYWNRIDNDSEDNTRVNLKYYNGLIAIYPNGDLTASNSYVFRRGDAKHADHDRWYEYQYDRSNESLKNTGNTFSDISWDATDLDYILNSGTGWESSKIVDWHTKTVVTEKGYKAQQLAIDFIDTDAQNHATVFKSSKYC